MILTRTRRQVNDDFERQPEESKEKQQQNHLNSPTHLMSINEYLAQHAEKGSSSSRARYTSLPFPKQESKNTAA